MTKKELKAAAERYTTYACAAENARKNDEEISRLIWTNKAGAIECFMATCGYFWRDDQKKFGKGWFYYESNPALPY